MEQLIGTWNDFLSRLSIGKSIERFPKYLLVFAILAVNFLSFDLSANEEQYMLFAKAFMNPDWIHSVSLHEFPGARLLYQIILGFFLKYFSFENVLFFSRLILCFLFAQPISKLYKALKVSNVQILLHLPILFLLHQSLFAGSWMLLTVEPKGVAYVFILYAVYYFMRSRFGLMTLFLIIGSYFHVLVGGYAFIYLMIAVLLFSKRAESLKALKYAVVYLVALLPFVYYLRLAVDKPTYTPSVDWIYTYFRSRHHTALFKDLGYFYSKHFYGVLLCFFSLIFSIYLFRILKNDYLKRLNQFVFVSLAGVLLFVIVAYFDTQGVLLKYYPFRINSLSTFILTLLVSTFIFLIVKSKYHLILHQIVVMLAVLFLLKMTVTTCFGMYKHFTNNAHKSLEATGEYIKLHTDKDAVILSFTGDLSLSRRMERDRFVVYKFIPAEMNKIPDWYERVNFKRALAKNISLLRDRKVSYKIDYILSRHTLDTDFLKLSYSDGSYYLYEVEP